MDIDHEDRATLDDDSHHREATEAVAHFVEELQAGIDHHDAEVYNRHFAADVLWGSPFGAVRCHRPRLRKVACHSHPTAEARAGRTVVALRDRQCPRAAPNVIVAHIRRVALDHAGRPVTTSDTTDAFSEMALYVLVRRG